jgi:hypothetical protein
LFGASIIALFCFRLSAGLFLIPDWIFIFRSMNMELVILTSVGLNVLAHQPLSSDEACDGDEHVGENEHVSSNEVELGCNQALCGVQKEGREMTSFFQTDLAALNQSMHAAKIGYEEFRSHLFDEHLNRCSFKTLGEFELQCYYSCNDCGYQACVLCALACHKGHNLSVTMHAQFYCDCGEPENQHRCVFHGAETESEQERENENY